MTKINDLSDGVSVVIATLGGELLKDTIEQLNKGSIIPTEILICIPEEDFIEGKEMEVFNVKIIKTECRGQVAQRAVGFREARCPYVLQLDDDIILDHSCLEELWKVVSSNAKVAVKLAKPICLLPIADCMPLPSILNFISSKFSCNNSKFIE